MANVASTINALAWPMDLAGEGLSVLLAHCGYVSRGATIPNPRGFLLADKEQIGPWLEDCVKRIGVEAVAVNLSFASIGVQLKKLGPSLVLMPDGQKPRLLAILSQGRKGLKVITPDRSIQWLAAEDVRSSLCRDLESAQQASLQSLLNEAGLTGAQRARAQQGLLRQRLDGFPVEGVWVLRELASRSLWRQFRRLGLFRRLLWLCAAHGLNSLLWIASWSVIGLAALQGRFDPGWLLAWLLLLLTMVPFRLLVTWHQGQFAIQAGALIKQRLLFGALNLQPEQVRHQGAGQLYGRVIESQELENLSLSGGIAALVALIELIIAAGILALGAVGGFHSLLLVICVVVLGVAVFVTFQRVRQWTQSRVELTDDLVESMVGHRTRLAQQDPRHLHDGEDPNLAAHLEYTRAMDHCLVKVSLIPRGWLLLGLAGLMPVFVTGSASVTALAISLGGVLLCFRAFSSLSIGLDALARAFISWGQLRPLLKSATELQPVGSIGRLPDKAPPRGAELVHATDLSFNYHERREPVVHHCDLTIHVGDRILLQGSSGSGKSTLASLLSGLRQPDSGLLLMRGLDRLSIGAEAWRQKVVVVPQFHENHVFMAPFAFNLLMGRTWPPCQEDLALAESVCRELGLGELIDQMPAGIMQMVGDTGWQLSHGERSRLYIARALLQQADLLIFDESFAALDPENLKRALTLIFDRARTVLVIAHP